MLGDTEFVEGTLNQTDGVVSDTLPINKTYSFEQLLEDVCQIYYLKPVDVRSPGKQRQLRLAKAMICYIAIRLLRVKGIEVADYLNISQSAGNKLVTGYHPSEDHNAFVAEYL